MTDQQKHEYPENQDYPEQVRLLRQLNQFIQTSLWDEMMNRRREYWLWERKGSTQRNHHDID